MKFTILVLLFSSFFSVRAAQASSIMFSGVIDFVRDNSNVWNSDIFVGSPLTGNISYNSAAHPRTFNSSSRDYSDDINIGVTLSVGTSTWSFSNSNLFEEIEVKNTVPEDRFQLDAVGTDPNLFPSFLGQYNFQFEFRESSILLDLFDSPELPHGDGDISFEDAEFISGNFQNEGGGQFAAFTFQIDNDSIELSSVPESASMTFLFAQVAAAFTLFSRASRSRFLESRHSNS